MSNIADILEAARQRGKQAGLPYQGALTPAEAYAVLQANPEACLVDVRCRAELDWVGRIPSAVEVEWASYPGMIPNSHFLTQLEQQVPVNAVVLFICRSGARSNAAAAFATREGYAHCYNVLEGFEGDKNSGGHRNETNGWRKAGLPWVQG